MAALNDEQLDEIRRHLDEGMTPDAIADYLGRVADLDLMDIVTIRSAAVALSRGETPRPHPPPAATPHCSPATPTR